MLLGWSAVSAQSDVAKEVFDIKAGDLKLTLMVGNDNRLYQLHFGDAGKQVAVPEKMPSREQEFLPPYGNGVITEPAIQATHTDGNTSTDLHYVKHTTEKLSDDVEQTVISLQDPEYKFFVDVYVKCYENAGMMEIWNTIRHDERGGKVTLHRYASASPILKAPSYWLTQFNGRYKREATLEEERLGEGVKIIDSKLGIRAHQYRIPSFLVSYNHEARENDGEVFAASLKWPGSFQMAFDMDWNKNLRVLTGINPLGAQYNLERGATFTTPAIVWTYSKNGKGGNLAQVPPLGKGLRDPRPAERPSRSPQQLGGYPLRLRRQPPCLAL